MAFKIYTKTGDKGKTSLLGGTKVSKADVRIEAYGTVDELNAFIGSCIAGINHEASLDTLNKIQNQLFVIGSLLACDPQKEIKMALPQIAGADVSLLEAEIDKMEDVLTPLKYFIIPSGSMVTTQLHIARCVCRRAERVVVRLDADDAELAPMPILLKYLNRLSDYLFVLSRYIAHLQKEPEQYWKP